MNHLKTSHAVYFYIPGAESLNVLYFLSSEYKNNLTVITPSVSVKEVCNILGVTSIYPSFLGVVKNNTAENKKWGKIYKTSDYLHAVFAKVTDILSNIKVMYKAKDMIQSMPDRSLLYFSTYYYDVPGIIFLGVALKSRKVRTKLIWPSKIRFDKIIRPPVFSETFLLNLMLQNLFTHHIHPFAGKTIGVNPKFLCVNNAEFVNTDIEKYTIPEKFKTKVLESLNLNFKNKIRVLLLGEYSVDQGITTYGGAYLRLLKMLGELDGIDVFYKPHPLYQSISHPGLGDISVLDTQIPVEFLDDGSWTYIVSFISASLITKKKAKCVCLLKLRELGHVPFNLEEAIKWMEDGGNEIIYPTSLESFRNLLTEGIGVSR